MFQVCVLGTSSAVPAAGRHPTCQVVNHYEHLLLLDCGEGAQFQLQRWEFKLRKLDSIFITHLHGDHVFGLPGLLTSMSIYGRKQLLTLVGPQGIRDFLEHQFKLSYTYLGYPVQYQETVAEANFPLQVYENSRLVVNTFPLQHRVPAYGYLLQEKPKRPKLRIRKAEQLGVPTEQYALVKLGNDALLPSGQRVPAAELLLPPEPAYSYAFCTDTRYNPALVPYLQGATVLYHEATFMDALSGRAEETGHATTLQAAKIAQAAGVQQLIIGHYSARYKHLQPLLQEAQSIFPATELAIEGDFYSIPPVMAS